MRAYLQRLVQRWQNTHISWAASFALVGLFVLLFATLITNKLQHVREVQAQASVLQTQLTESLDQERSLRLRLADVGTAGNKDNEARALSFMKPGEIRFMVVDPEYLDNYR